MVVDPMIPNSSRAIPAAINDPVPTSPNTPSVPPATTGVTAITTATITAASHVAFTASAVVRNQCATDRANTAAATTVTSSRPCTTQWGLVVGNAAANGTSGIGPRDTANTLYEASPRCASPPTRSAAPAITTFGRYATEIPVSAAVPTKPLPISITARIGSHANRTPINTSIAEMAHIASTNAIPRWIPPRTHSGSTSRSSRRKYSHTPTPDPAILTAAVQASATGSDDSRTAKSDAAEPTNSEARPVRAMPATVTPAIADAASRPPGCSMSDSTACVCRANTTA